MDTDKVEKEISKIIERNKNVEQDKAWETSKTRLFFISALTYIFASILLYIIKNEKPFINALVPTLGYFLSSQSLPFIKKWWIKNK